MKLPGAWREDPTALLRRIAVSGWIAAIAITGAWTFFYLKHDRVLGCVIPFSRDPFDAVGSFAVIAAVPLSLLVLVRTFTTPIPDSHQRLAPARMALLLGFALMWLSDLIAMAAHHDWYGGGATEITALVVGQFLACVATLTVQSRRSVHAGATLLTAFASLPVFIAVLWLFPQAIIATAPGEFAALAFGDLWLFWQMALWTGALAPVDGWQDAATSERRRLAVPAAVLMGAVMGALILSLEANESGGILPSRLLLVAIAFVGGGGLGVGLGYAFLRRPLSLP